MHCTISFVFVCAFSLLLVVFVVLLLLLRSRRYSRPCFTRLTLWLSWACCKTPEGPTRTRRETIGQCECECECEGLCVTLFFFFYSAPSTFCWACVALFFLLYVFSLLLLLAGGLFDGIEVDIAHVTTGFCRAFQRKTCQELSTDSTFVQSCYPLFSAKRRAYHHRNKNIKNAPPGGKGGGYSSLI